MARKSVSIHSDYFLTLRKLARERRGDILDALICWALDTDIPQLDEGCGILFDLMCAQMERISTANSANGKRGGAPACNSNAQTSETSETNETSEDKRNKPTVSVSVPVTVTNSPPSVPPAGEAEEKPKGEKLTRAEETAQLNSLKVSGELRSALDRWLAYKREKRQTYTLTGLTTLIKTVQKKAAECGNSAVIAGIDAAISSNYTGIVWERVRPQGSRASLGSRALGHPQRHYSQKQLEQIGVDLLDAAIGENDEV